MILPHYLSKMNIANDVPLKKEQGIATLNLTSIIETDIVDIILSHLSSASITSDQYHSLLEHHFNEIIETVKNNINM